MPWSQAAPGDEMSAGREQQHLCCLGKLLLPCPAQPSSQSPPEPGQSLFLP